MSNVYVLKAGPYYKIGKADDVAKRICSIQTHCPHRIEKYLILPVEDSARAEGDLHRKHQKYWFRGEWFIDIDEALLAEYGEVKWVPKKNSRGYSLKNLAVSIPSTDLPQLALYNGVVDWTTIKEVIKAYQKTFDFTSAEGYESKNLMEETPGFYLCKASRIVDGRPGQTTHILVYKHSGRLWVCDHESGFNIPMRDWLLLSYRRVDLEDPVLSENQ
jgi:hypothetical protein